MTSQVDLHPSWEGQGHRSCALSNQTSELVSVEENLPDGLTCSRALSIQIGGGQTRLGVEQLKKLNYQWDPFTVDSAFRASTQLPRFFSWKPDPEVE